MLTKILGSDQANEGVAPFSSLSDRVYDHVVRNMVNHKYELGGRLTENGVAKELKVSTVPVRDALQRLHQDGWIQRFPFKGAVVSKLFDPAMVEDLYLTRQIIEVGSAYRAAATLTPEHQSELEKAAHELIDNEGLSGRDRMSHEIRFHGLIVEIGASPRLKALYDPILLQYYVAADVVLKGRLHADESDTYQKLYDAIAAGEGEEAARLTRQLLDSHYRGLTQSVG